MNTLDMLSILQREKLQRLRREAENHRAGKRSSPRTAHKQVAPLPRWVGQHPQNPLKPLA